MLKADLHVHTFHSVDSNMSYEQLIAACLKKGVNCIAVADHGTTLGARELSRIAPFKVIVCEEILTPYGEIMGMFLKEDIPFKTGLEETLSRIRDQGGLVNIPHPYDMVRPSAFRDKAMLEKIAERVEMIEIFNARSLTPGTDKKARDLALRHGRIATAGSDAHSATEIGYVTVDMPDFNTKEEFLSALARAEMHCRKSSPLIHIISSAARLSKKNKQE